MGARWQHQNDTSLQHVKESSDTVKSFSTTNVKLSQSIIQWHRGHDHFPERAWFDVVRGPVKEKCWTTLIIHYFLPSPSPGPPWCCPDRQRCRPASSSRMSRLRGGDSKLVSTQEGLFTTLCCSGRTAQPHLLSEQMTAVLHSTVT